MNECHRSVLTGEALAWQLTNEQRRCFGIAPVEDEWTLNCLPRSKYDHYDTWYYQEGLRIRYIILHGEKMHQEYAVDELLSEDGAFIVPKRAAKPIKLTAAALIKRGAVGMHLWWTCDHAGSGLAGLENADSRQTYYRSDTAGQDIATLEDFQAWIDQWCAQTTAEDQADIEQFAGRPVKTVRYREGDYFRFRWYRRIWGYGRILLSYDRMRRQKIPFYDCMMGKPVVVQLLKIIATDAALPVARLEQAPVLLSFNMMDDVLHYGEYEIVGHAELPADIDALCPIMYGVGPQYDGVLRFQQGRTYRELPGGKALGKRSHINNSVGFYLQTSLPEMLRYINQPGCGAYWTDSPWRWQKEEDLRNPINAGTLRAIRKQMGL